MNLCLDKCRSARERAIAAIARQVGAEMHGRQDDLDKLLASTAGMRAVPRAMAVLAWARQWLGVPLSFEQSSVAFIAVVGLGAVEGVQCCERLAA